MLVSELQYQLGNLFCQLLGVVCSRNNSHRYAHREISWRYLCFIGVLKPGLPSAFFLFSLGSCHAFPPIVQKHGNVCHLSVKTHLFGTKKLETWLGVPLIATCGANDSVCFSNSAGDHKSDCESDINSDINSDSDSHSDSDNDSDSENENDSTVTVTTTVILILTVAVAVSITVILT